MNRRPPRRSHWLKASAIPGSTWKRVTRRTWAQAADTLIRVPGIETTAFCRPHGISGAITFDGRPPAPGMMP